MAPPLKRISIGSKFGRWTVVGETVSMSTDDAMGRRVVCLCECTCGKQREVRTTCLSTGKSLSCGCLQHEMLSRIAYRHGGHKTPIYHVWQSMVQRCESTSHPSYSDYGGRGISVCAEWRDSFATFRTWAAESGYTSGLAIDRRDNESGYSPANCRWVTHTENNRNRRNTVFVDAFGQRKTIEEWLDIAVVNRSAVARRLKRGWSGEQALTTPARAQPA